MASETTHYPVGVTILGSTGTIGVNTLDVVARHSSRFHLVALTGNTNIALLFEQCLEWQPLYAVMADENAARQLERQLHEAGVRTEVLSGVEGLVRVCELPEVDQVMAGIVGGAGLLPTLAAARAGKRVLLANKESLVMSGSLLIDAARDNQAELLPIDSEHNAIFQCMPPMQDRKLADVGVSKILLTASGGPFRTWTIEQLQNVTPEQACAHPNWVMGKKISVDSATMMNKGLEIIEACWLFDTSPALVEVVVHPQSVIHSMVAYNDGSVLAQMGNPDMRTPIAHAMGWPQRIESGVEPLSLFEVAQLDFERPDETRFPCLRLARQACEAGGSASITLNAANEVAVAAFLDQQISFMAIPDVISHCLEAGTVEQCDSIETILAMDEVARNTAQGYIKGLV